VRALWSPALLGQQALHLLPQGPGVGGPPPVTAVADLDRLKGLVQLPHRPHSSCENRMKRGQPNPLFGRFTSRPSTMAPWHHIRRSAEREPGPACDSHRTRRTALTSPPHRQAIILVT